MTVAMKKKEDTERPRMIFDTQERYRRAIKLYAAKHGLSTSEVINKALDAYVAKELLEADEILSGDKSTKGKGRS